MEETLLAPGGAEALPVTLQRRRSAHLLAAALRVAAGRLWRPPHRVQRPRYEIDQLANFRVAVSGSSTSDSCSSSPAFALVSSSDSDATFFRLPPLHLPVKGLRTLRPCKRIFTETRHKQDHLPPLSDSSVLALQANPPPLLVCLPICSLSICMMSLRDDLSSKLACV